MIGKLKEIVLYKLPELLEKQELWDSLIINRRKPFTYRVFTQIDDIRCCLHKFDPCHDHEAFAHPHPWPGAFMILKGSYQMKIGFSTDRISKPVEVMSTIMTKHSCYEIINPLTWHSVIPLEPTYTIMINGAPWDLETAHKDIRTTKGKDLEKMPEKELSKHLSIFKELIVEYAHNLYDLLLEHSTKPIYDVKSIPIPPIAQAAISSAIKKERNNER